MRYLTPPFINLLMWWISLYVKSLPLLLPSPPLQTLLYPTRILTLCTWLPPSSFCLYPDTPTQGYPDVQKPPLPSLGPNTPWWTAVPKSLSSLRWHCPSTDIAPSPCSGSVALLWEALSPCSSFLSSDTLLRPLWLTPGPSRYRRGLPVLISSMSLNPNCSEREGEGKMKRKKTPYWERN